MTITEFLEARIAEDEQQAKSCQYLGWFPAKKYGVTTVSHARVLAECAAKRAIIKQAEEATGDRGTVIAEYCGSDAERTQSWAEDPGKLILEALASVYRDHPDYRQEWAA
ncbi:DUF6221 family protein [Arthrobacter sp. StoSoilB22]|uniref:DUF6221 family protein n=1 Tax=Arthrobacter sp. StoSoilB22 TaxID=2830996 RepID=UPI001CC5F4BF|nr:DUF6221 family protein [Arthrobacter sp. StoSoilB22]BCW61910.1 hypothetical protein StoSoilB22_08830 [Arthrobacter sp. StoSoilB22]